MLKYLAILLKRPKVWGDLDLD